MSNSQTPIHTLDHKDYRYTPKQKARAYSLLFILLWLIFLLIPMFAYMFPPPEKTGILLSFGENGGGNTIEEVVESNKTTKEERQQEEKPAKEIKTETKEKTATKQSKTVEESSPVKADTKTASVEPTKKKTNPKSTETSNPSNNPTKEKEDFGAFFKKGTNNQQENGKPGDRNGDPDINRLDGLTSGKSTIGDGLAKRGITFEPVINDDSQKTGKVVVKVCVNQFGDVISSKYTQSGSTTTDLELIKIAEDAASKYKFSPSGIEKQCGQIVIEFILK